jgi:hypothetical protein
MDDKQNNIAAIPTLTAGPARHHESSAEIAGDALLAAIAASVASDRLTVIAGAGVSFAAGLPSWGVLLKRLSTKLLDAEVRAAFELLARIDSPLVVARYLKAQLRVPDAFHTTVREALFAGDVDYARANPTLDLILAIVRRAKAAGVSIDVITYNFDDLIECAVRARMPNVSVESVVDERGWQCLRADVRVLHVHGLLPRDEQGPVLPPPPLVLSEDEFHRLMNDPHLWQNRCQADAFAWRDCLFLGLSLADPNLRRVIDYATVPGRACAGHRWIVSRRYRNGEDVVVGDPTTRLNALTAAALNAVKTGLHADLAAHTYWVDGFDEISALAPALNVA